LTSYIARQSSLSASATGAAPTADLGRQRLDAVRAPGRAEHLETLRGQPPGGCGADAAARAGDDRGTGGEFVLGGGAHPAIVLWGEGHRAPGLTHCAADRT
jgi:hypothetical protein